MPLFQRYACTKIKRKFMRIYVLLSLSISLLGCGKDIPPPTYLRIDEFTLDPNIDLNYGQLTHAFQDVYAYVDGQKIGVFPVPCVIPLNLEGSHKIQLIPAVRVNGQSGAKSWYPFVEPHIENINFTRLDTAEIQPRTKYYSTLQVWHEDFEDASMQIQSTGIATANMTRSSDPNIREPRNGNFFGLVELTDNNAIWEAISTMNWSIPPGKDAFLEIDFYNTNYIQPGLQKVGLGLAGSIKHDLIISAQKPENVVWKKMYINMADLVAFAGVGNNLSLLFYAVKNGATDSFIAIDNIKLVYRP